MRILAPPGVFRPRSDTWLLAEHLRREPRLPGAQVLDLCCGSGALLLVHSSVCDEAETLRRLREQGLEAEVAERRRGPLGPLLWARAEALEARGLLRSGVREEELVVVRAVSPAPGRAGFRPARRPVASTP